MSRLSVGVACALGALVVASCTSTRYGAYYEPSYPDTSGVARERACPRATILELRAAHDVRIELALAPDGKDLHASLSLRVPKDVTVAFDSDRFTFEDPVSGARRVHEVTRFAANPYLVDASAAPGPALMDAVTGGFRSVTIVIDDFSPRRVRLRLPPLSIDGERFVPGPIDFEYRNC